MRGTANILLVGLAAIGERSPKVGLVKFRNANTTCHAVFDKQRPYSEPGASRIVDITGREFACQIPKREHHLPCHVSFRRQEESHAKGLPV